jgi:GT2 family glycosyltransferase
MDGLVNMTPTNLLVVIVLHEKKISEINFLEKIKSSDINLDILVYDNSLLPQGCDGLGLTYYHDSTNPGVSTAYNNAFSYANKKNKSAVLLDQDTSFEPENIHSYLEMYSKYGEDYIYAPIITDSDFKKIYSPSHMNFFVGKALNIDKLNYTVIYNLSQKSVINSGLLVPLSIYDKIGGYNNKIKLDFSDIYFVEKYKEINKNIILINLHIKHSLSGDEGINFVAEMNRFPYYCIGAMELSKSLNKSTLWTILRRTSRLVIKYRSISPFLLFFKYYIKRDEL